MPKGMYRRTRSHACQSCRTSYDAGECWLDYFCPGCGEHNDNLYRAEHLDPVAARSLTRAGIVAEYRAAGRRFAPIHLSRADMNHHRGAA